MVVVTDDKHTAVRGMGERREKREEREEKLGKRRVNIDRTTNSVWGFYVVSLVVRTSKGGCSVACSNFLSQDYSE